MTDSRAPGASRFPLRLDALAPRAGAVGVAPFDRAPVVPVRVAGAATVERPAAALSPTAAAARAVLRPQRLVEHVHREALLRRPPTGIGLDSVDVRRRMAMRLEASGVAHRGLLDAFASVPRHRFVDAALVTQAYEDTSLPIGHGQTISKPSVVARMIELLLAGDTARRSASLGRVLEVGTGCGYQAALLALLGRQVISVERLRPLHEKARALLAPLRLTTLRLQYGDGMLGAPGSAPFDSIVAAAGGDALPQAWLDQLAIGGRIVAPLRQPGSGQQALIVVDRHEHGFERTVHETVHFVPLKSGTGTG